jgi:hypothetical protein
MVFAAMLIGMFLLARARFGWVLFYYLTLETLAAEVKAVPLLVQFRSEITCEAPEVLNRFQQFEAEVIQTVRVRFRVLAQSLFPEQANADADAFRCVAEVRNDLIHGRLTDIPLDDEPNVNSLVQELAERYLHAVLKKLDLSGHTAQSYRSGIARGTELGASLSHHVMLARPKFQQYSPKPVPLYCPGKFVVV